MFLQILEVRIYEFLYVLFFCMVDVFRKEKNAELTFNFSKQNNLQLFTGFKNCEKNS